MTGRRALPDVVELAQALIRLDTSNPPGGERAAIELLADVLGRAGLESAVVARDPARPNLVARLRGRGEAPGLLMHGHVDVVPAAGEGWRHAPFSGRVVDGVLWGRGAIDMKGAVAQMVVALARLASGGPPAGDVIFAALADEEGGSHHGARFLVSEHPALLEGAEFAIGELGAVSTEIGGRRLYPVAVSEKQWCVVRVSVRGRGGHGSVPVRGEAMAKLADVLGRLDRSRLPLRIPEVSRAMVEGVAGALSPAEAARLRAVLDPAGADDAFAQGGRALALFDAALHNTVAPTRLHGSSRVDAIPDVVGVDLDARVLPGSTPAELTAELRELCGPGVEIEVRDTQPPAVEEPDMSLFPTLAAAIVDVDPAGVAVPMVLPGVTDGRFLTALGIQCYGFTPLRLPRGFPLPELIHGVDERVPVESLRFGVEVLGRLLARMAEPSGPHPVAA